MILWNTHLNQLITEVSRASYAIRTIKSFMSTDALIMVCDADFHSLMSYGLIFWGNSSHSTNIFLTSKEDRKNYHRY
jgi:hypothetical protein